MKKLTISFVIPVYNEEKRIKKTFEALMELSLPAGLAMQEIIFVNDGSTDKTTKRIEQFAQSSPSTYPIRLVTYAQNKGKGFAIKQGMLESRADYTLFFDADMSTPLTQIAKFIPAMNKNVDVIVGTRKNGKSTVVIHQPRVRELLGKGFTKLTQYILSVDITDFTCGFKAYSARAKEVVFTRSEITGWGYDAENIFLAQKNGFTITEVPVLWSNDNRSRVKLYKDVPKSFGELIHIRYLHTLRPMLWESSLSESMSQQTA